MRGIPGHGAIRPMPLMTISACGIPVVDSRRQGDLLHRAVYVDQDWVEPNMSRRDAIGKPGRGKSLTYVIGSSSGREAAKISWEPIMRHSGGRPDARNLSASRRTLSTRGGRAARSRWRA